MSRSLAVIVGALAGLATATALSSGPFGCSCPDTPTFPAGKYVAVNPSDAEPDWSLSLATDRLTATETFTRRNEAYVINYSARFTFD